MLRMYAPQQSIDLHRIPSSVTASHLAESIDTFSISLEFFVLNNLNAESYKLKICEESE